jgi:hypothetical protein
VNHLYCAAPRRRQGWRGFVWATRLEAHVSKAPSAQRLPNVPGLCDSNPTPVRKLPGSVSRVSNAATEELGLELCVLDEVGERNGHAAITPLSVGTDGSARSELRRRISK